MTYTENLANSKTMALNILKPSSALHHVMFAFTLHPLLNILPQKKAELLRFKVHVHTRILIWAKFEPSAKLAANGSSQTLLVTTFGRNPNSQTLRSLKCILDSTRLLDAMRS